MFFQLLFYEHEELNNMFSTISQEFLKEIAGGTELTFDSKLGMLKHGAATGLELVMSLYVDGADDKALLPVAEKAEGYMTALSDTWPLFTNISFHGIGID